MASPPVSRRRRTIKFLRLFVALVAGFLFQYARARLSGRRYDFFADSVRNRRRAVRIRTTALEMGGVLIKVGQFLSSRVDLLPPEYIEELALLQDEVPGVPFGDLVPVIEAELGGRMASLFARVDPDPLAAASLGQVHLATLPSGQTIALKVQRPRIDEIVEADLGNLRFVVNWLDRWSAVRRRADLRAVFREFEETLRRELDYVGEGHHAERIAVMFAGLDEVAVPRVYWSHTARRVIALQYMTGVKVNDFVELERRDISRRAVAEILMRAYLKQVLQDGFFHADPHPGNILVRPGPIIVLLDFGMVGEITPHMRENIRRVFIGIVRRDFDDVLSALASLGFIGRDADLRSLKRALVWTVDTFYELSFGELQQMDPAFVLNELQDVLFSQPIHVPANYAFLGRALGTLSGLCTALDPSFQFVSVAEPYARELVRRDRGFRGAFGQIAHEARALAMNAYTIPFLARDVLDDINRGELDFRREFAEVARSVDRLERAMRRLLYGLLVAGFVTAGAYSFHTRYSAFALGALALAVLFLVLVFVPFRRRR